MENFKLEAPDSPNRCQAVTVHGQCNQARVVDSLYCRMHGGIKVDERKARDGLRNYQLTRFNARLQQLGDSSEIKSLRDEVAILRMVLEERLNQCRDNMDLIYQSGPISDLVLKIEKVVVSCHKLELATGSLLDKQAILTFGTELLSILGSEIKDQDILSRLSEKIYGTISRTVAYSAGDED